MSQSTLLSKEQLEEKSREAPAWPGWPEVDSDDVSTVPPTSLEAFHRTLSANERQWVLLQPWLESQGYMLRPRFRPGWTPSWDNGKRPYYMSEDGVKHMMYGWNIMDAIHIERGRRVILKHIPTAAEKSSELKITQLLSSELHRVDPRNHAIPLLDVLCAPDTCFMVFPLFRSLLCMREFDRLRTLGEGLDLVDQTLEGLAYLHELGIAHRDCAISNVVMDADRMFPRSFHPDAPWKDARGRPLKHTRSRTCAGRVNYHLIDFGESMQFDPSKRTRIMVQSKASLHALETANSKGYDPFKVDVWAMGTTYTNVLLTDYPGDFTAFSELFKAMASTKPKDRPTAGQALARFRFIRASLSRTALHSRVRHRQAKREAVVCRAFKVGWHWAKQFGFAARNRQW